MVFVSQTFTIAGIDYIISDQAQAASLAMQQELINALTKLGNKLTK